jgi:thioredoxin 1
MNNNIIEGTDYNFKNEVLASNTPVLVDFWAPWCGPCRMVAPIVEELANEFQGKLKVVKLNTDENFNVASQYGIMSIPTLGIFKDGRMVDAVIGAVPKHYLVNKLNPHLGNTVN